MANNKKVYNVYQKRLIKIRIHFKLMSSFERIIKSELKKKNIYSKEKVSKLKEKKSDSNNNDIYLNPINSSAKDVENIIMKYISHNHSYINNIIHVNIISNYLYNSKRLQSFINLNDLSINDFVPIVLNSKILLCQSGNCIYKQGDDYLGFYALIKGNIKVKVSRLNYILEISPNYKEEILKEYNLDKSDVIWSDATYNNDNIFNRSHKNNALYLNSSSIFTNRKHKRNSIKDNLILLSRKSINNLNNEYSEEKDLFLYKSKKGSYSSDRNDILLFGGINLFNNYMIDVPEIHLSSVYSFSDDIKNKSDSEESIFLYFREESLKELREKITKNNKKRIKFLKKKLLPMTEFTEFEINKFVSNMKLIFIHVNEKKDIQINNNIFFLVYKGECYDYVNKNFIYSEGDFVNLSNIFQKKNENNKIISLYSNSSNTIIFQIDLGALPNFNIIIIKKFLMEIYKRQKNIRIDYNTNKKRYSILFNEDEKEEKNKNNQEFSILYSNKFGQFTNYRQYKKYCNYNSNNEKEKNIINKSYGNNLNYIERDNKDKKIINSFMLCSFDKNWKNKLVQKNNSSSNLVKLKLTKANFKNLFILNNYTQKYYSKNKINFKNNSMSIYKDKSNTLKNLSTKNSTTYSKIRIKKNNNIKSTILFDYTAKVKPFNASTTKYKEVEADIGNNLKNIKCKNFLNDLNLNKSKNIISSLILSKKNIHQKTSIIESYLKSNYVDKSDYIDYNNKRNKSLSKQFHKRIFLENIQQNLNILKSIYHKKNIDKSGNNNFSKNKRYSSLNK